MKTKKKYNLIQTLLLGLALLVASPTLTMAAETLEKEKSNHALAMEVILGDWGNGQERKDRLTEAGYEYQAIQDIVNSYQGILYDVSLLMENNTAVKQNGTQETKQVTQAKRGKKTASKKGLFSAGFFLLKNSFGFEGIRLLSIKSAGDFE